MRAYALILAFLTCVLPSCAFFRKLNGLHSPLAKSSAAVSARAGNGRCLSRLQASIVSSGVSKASGLSPCSIKVVGVGGAGGNAVSRMREANVQGVEFWAVNTDAQILAKMPNGTNVVQIGEKVARGLGAGGVPEVGKQAAEESRAEISQAVSGADLVFVTAGMGGGTGSGAAPVVAEIAKATGALTVGVVTKPFNFEGRRRMSEANKAIERLRRSVDTLLVVSNDRLLELAPEGTPLTEAFKVADDVLRQGVVGISEIIVRPGLINVDFADVRTIMGNAGTALMGIGNGLGKNRAEEAAMQAITSPLLEIPLEKARGMVFNIVGGPDLTLQEINKAAEVIYQRMDPNANIIFGSLVDENMRGEVSITVIATGFDGDAEERQASEASAVSSSGSQQQPAQRKLRDWEHVYQQGHAARTSTSSAKPSEDLPSFLPKLKRF